MSTLITTTPGLKMTRAVLLGQECKPKPGLQGATTRKEPTEAHMKRVPTRTMTIYNEAKTQLKMARNGRGMHLSKAINI
jgi:hypothetical protein